MEELDLSRLLKLFWENKVQIILIILIFIVLGITYTMGVVEPMYTSSTTLLLATEQNATSTSGSSITTSELTLNSKLVSTYSELVKSKKVLSQVISNLNIDLSEDSLKKNVSVKAVSDTEMIKISVTNKDPEVAEKLANEIAKVFTEQVKEYFKINNVHVVDVAEKEENPSNINHTKDVVIFATIGAVISIIYVLLANVLDTTVKSAEEIEKLYSLPVLASIPIDTSDGKKGGKK